MPHAVLQSPLSLAQIGERFAPVQTAVGDTHINLLELFQSARNDTLLVEAYVIEEPMKQRVGLTIRRREDGNVVIGLHEIGFPRPTLGIQQAVRVLTEWVVGLDGDTAVLHHNLIEQ